MVETVRSSWSFNAVNLDSRLGLLLRMEPKIMITSSTTTKMVPHLKYLDDKKEEKPLDSLTFLGLDDSVIWFR